MNYPDWAPKNLVAIHLLSRLEKPYRSLDTGFHTELDTEQTIVQIRKECNEVSDQLIEKIRADLSLWSLFPPEKEKERTEILEKLITDQRMKAVWASIARRVEIELEFVHFWTICGTIIQGWHRAQKLSPKQHREYFQKIHEHALALAQLMNETVEFQHSSTTDLIETDSIKWLLKALNASLPKFIDEEEGISCARAYLSTVTPSIYVVLDDIAAKALTFSKEEPLVRKPNSENAHIHYFVRSLSGYLKKRYGQPLHEVVATTTGVVFNQEGIDTDYVRKLV